MMDSHLVLRFRDLVTEPGGTIREHRQVVDDRGYVWWGWWMRPSETPPQELFGAVYEDITAGVEQRSFLFDSGQELLYACRIADLRIAQPGEFIGPPEPEAAPAYYQRGQYPAWFKMIEISPDSVRRPPEGWSYAAFPTNPEHALNKELTGQPVESFAELRQTDATMWLMR